jgi:phosphoribosylglycinamide formyltransferase 1
MYNQADIIKIAVLISGTGRTLFNLHDFIKEGKLPAKIVSVICSNLNSTGADKAYNIDGISLNYVTKGSCEGSFAIQSSRVFEICRNKKVDLVCLAGWFNFLLIPSDFKNRIMNIHPSLLPAFGGKGMYGMNVHKQVIEHGCKWSGCTVHFVDDVYDHGPIIAQSVVRVLPSDTPKTLADKVFKKELILYPECIRAYAEGRVRVDGRKVLIG